MKVLITGGAGFLGSHICELFKAKNWEVIAFDSLTKYEIERTGYNVEKTRNYNVNFLKSIGVELVVADIRNYPHLWLAARDCDYIINCAAQPAMTVSLENPIYDAEVNIMGVLNVLKVARTMNIPAALCSSIHVYGNGINRYIEIDKKHNQFTFPEYPDGIDENWDEYLSGEITPLHVSKYSNELYARAFIESYNSEVFVARLTGLTASRQTGSEDHGWAAVMVIRTLLKQPIKIFGTSLQVRDILNAKDAAQAFFDWYHSKQESGVYNICGGIDYTTSINQWLAMIVEITGLKQQIELLPVRKGDLWYFVGDYSKANRAFGWKPVITPKQDAIEVINWSKENIDLFKAELLKK
jgi:CDP-paratose 2-epimerase